MLLEMNIFSVKIEKIFEKDNKIKQELIKNSDQFDIKFTEKGNCILIFLKDFQLNIISKTSNEHVIIDDILIEFFNSIILDENLIICTSGKEFNKIIIIDLNFSLCAELMVKGTLFLCAADSNQIILVDLENKASDCFLSFDWKLKFIRFIGQFNFPERLNYFPRGIDIDDIVINNKCYFWLNNNGINKIDLLNSTKDFKEILNGIKIFNLKNQIFVLKRENGFYYLEMFSFNLKHEKTIKIPHLELINTNIKKLAFLKVDNEQTLIIFDRDKNVILRLTLK